MDIDFIKLDVASRIEQIASMLQTQDPQLPTHLAAIHSALIQYEELVHLLSDEQITQLIAGQTKHVSVQLSNETIAKPSARMRIPKTSVDDL